MCIGDYTGETLYSSEAVQSLETRSLLTNLEGDGHTHWLDGGDALKF